MLYAQPEAGYRTGIEPVLMAACVPAQAGQRVLELGTGAGAALLCLAARVPGLTGCGVERDAVMAGLARSNMAANGAAFEVLHADVESLPAQGPFDHAMANPPWHDPAATRPAHARVAAAKQRGPGGLAPWIEALAAATRPGGTITLALPAILAHQAAELLSNAGWAAQTLLSLLPREGRPAKLVLLQARHSGGTLEIARTLVLHGDGPGYTPEAEAILRQGLTLHISPLPLREGPGEGRP